MRRGIAYLLTACLMAAHPARAEKIEENEPMVMRLIFDDCLGYVRHGRTPFQGVATGPASQVAIEHFPALMPNREQIVELLSPRYAAAWGEDQEVRYCILRTVFDDLPSRGPGLLGVRRLGFVARVTERAVTQGLTERSPEDEFSSIVINTWSEPETGHETGPLRPVRFNMIPVDINEDGSLADAGSIVMAGPSLGRP